MALEHNGNDVMSEIERIAQTRARYHDEVEAQQAADTRLNKHEQLMGIRDALEALRDSYDIDADDEYSRIDGLAALLGLVPEALRTPSGE